MHEDLYNGDGERDEGVPPRRNPLRKIHGPDLRANDYLILADSAFQDACRRSEAALPANRFEGKEPE